LFTIGIAALFLAGFFLLVVLGAKSYQNTVAGQSENNRVRALSSYLTAVVRANDGRGAVSVQQGEDGQILVIDDGSGYSLRIYRHDGALLEEYAAREAALAPADAQVIAATGVFAIEKLSDGLLRVTTDAGSVLLHLRSEGGATP